MKSLTIKMHIDKEGRLVTSTPTEKKLYERYMGELNPGDQVEVHFSLLKDDGTYPQISKIHVSIREIAKETGHTFDEIKDIIKQRAGFIQQSSEGVSVKSFADMSKEELSSCIEEIMRLGSELGLLL